MDRYEPEFDELVGRSAELELVADGFVFTEGPAWDFAAGQLYFSDIPSDTMYRYFPDEGVKVHRRPSNFSNGLAFDGDGALLACEHRTRRISRTTGGTAEPVVESYRGRRLNAPNDLVVARDGSVLFTDPHYGLGEGFGGPAEQEQPFRGVYRVPPGSHEPELLADDFDGPNGLALSPAEDRLYVDDTERGHIRFFGIAGDWAVSGGDVLTEIRGDGDGVLDGMKVDATGNLYCTGPGGIWVCSPEGGILGRIRTPEVAANLAWGGGDARAMYITASTGLYRMRCLASGHTPHRRS